MAKQTAWCGDNHIGTHLQSLGLYVETATVVAAIYSDTRDTIQIVSKTLHGLVYLLCQFSCRRHHNTVDSILRVSPVIEH